VGPDLTGIGARQTADQIRHSIIDPGAVIAEGFTPSMPKDLADKMTARELEMIVRFLARQKGSS
jgi:cbb3-type cytochrome oxidase cytochrome c subunit